MAISGIVPFLNANQESIKADSNRFQMVRVLNPFGKVINSRPIALVSILWPEICTVSKLYKEVDSTLPICHIFNKIYPPISHTFREDMLEGDNLVFCYMIFSDTLLIYSLIYENVRSPDVYVH